MANRLHTGSALVGAIALGAIMLLLGAFQQVQFQAQPINEPLRVQYMPHPRQMVRIREGVPYTVPNGMTFVLTALGRIGNASSVAGVCPVGFLVDGEGEVSACTIDCGSSSNPSGVSIASVPPGLAVPAGSVISLSSSGGTCGAAYGRAWGYLVRQ